jgi:hypothetical protein
LIVNEFMQPLKLIAFTGGLAVLAFACSHGARVDGGNRAPSSNDSHLERMLRTCGPVPVREVAKRLTLSPRATLEWPKEHVFYSNRNCASPPCGKIVAEKYRSSPFAHGFPGAYAAFTTGLLNVARPAGQTQDRVIAPGDRMPIAGATFKKIFERDPDGLKQIQADEYYLELVNPDLSLADAVENLSPYFDVSIDSSECPLPAAEQGDRCAEHRLPYDRTEATLLRNDGAFRKSEEFKKAGVGRRIDYKQNTKGYSYLVEYEDAEGRVVPRSDETRFTASRYVVLDAFTRVPCPGWKIRKVALNAHNGKWPYAYYRDEAVDPKTGKTVFKQTKTDQLKPADFQYFSSHLNDVYKPGADLTFNLCYSIDHRLGTNSNVGNVFRDVPVEQNPIGKVVGVPGTCVTFSDKADAKNFHVFPVWLFQVDGKVSGRVHWKNPKYHPNSRDAGKTYPLKTGKDLEELENPKTMHTRPIHEGGEALPAPGGQ